METYGLTLIEAMSCGIPVVAFRTGGVPEAVPEQGGILCEQLDADAFKAAIQKLRHSEELRNELGKCGEQARCRSKCEESICCSVCSRL